MLGQLKEMCSHAYLNLALKLKQTPTLIVCSACIRFIAHRRQSLLIRFNVHVAVSHLSVKLDLTCTAFAVQKGRAFDIYMSRLLLIALKCAGLKTKTDEK